jgi:hypothetical protein
MGGFGTAFIRLERGVQKGLEVAVPEPGKRFQLQRVEVDRITRQQVHDQESGAVRVLVDRHPDEGEFALQDRVGSPPPSMDGFRLTG